MFRKWLYKRAEWGGVPCSKLIKKWSIGIYFGTSPFDLYSPDEVKNPVLTSKNVNDVRADFVADPFMIKHGPTWYMFFEIQETWSQLGMIGLATSLAGFKWEYQKVVLREPFHLSYPYTFYWNRDFYMVPETCQTRSVRLYKAIKFPFEWAYEKDLLSGQDCVDPSIIFYNGKFWMFTSTIKNDTLDLHFADTITGPWTPHPQNPIVNNDLRTARPGGRVVEVNGKIFRYAQSCTPSYGNEVHAFEIKSLTTESYSEREFKSHPIISKTGVGWNAFGMHHIDPHQIEKNKWIACVDGYQKSLIFRKEF